ncbi:EAL domain-containing protein [Stakelama saccharophila]|uniref:EAL domain-containing protein n=1 Tax=Stakelama saccharophila TaxID=3075605 RepID=A0ABZ0BB99_9SPHN|nr:EAL domain-containing protein [Stakelama sp. W311]WNO54325.1 EAL domain-containing protein [Stakelama sp. W311]
MSRNLRSGLFGRSARASDGDGTDWPQRAMRLVEEFETSSAGWFWETDRHGRLTYLSAKVVEQIDAGDGAVMGQPLGEVFVVDGASSDTERTLSFHLTSRVSFSDYSVRSRGVAGQERWWSISGRPIFDEVGNFRGFIGNGSDLTEKRRSEAEINRLALFDSLTDLANRQRMRISLDQTLAETSGYRATALMLLDLDRFKAVNDTLGHQTGDALLKQVGQRLSRAVGGAGLVGRMGGDEFQVILPNEGGRDRLSELAERIIAALSQPYFLNGSSISIGCSIGIAIAPGDGEDSETLVRNGDLALYAAKADGRGLHRFYHQDMLIGAQSRKQLEDDLRTALAQNQLHVAYQPVVSTKTTRIVGFEALVRWTHPERGAISPAEFIPIAEDCGLIESIGEWVLRTACHDVAHWPGDVRVAVNVSPIQFANPALPTIVTSALAGAGIAAGRLELEITEGVFLNESSSSEQMFRKLKAIGVRLALDDFGTGYSSLGYLKNAPFDKIKIDQSFVRGAAVPGNRNAAIIKAIVMLAETLGMETTAEGLEVQDEIELIRELGCSHVQGYVYGKPMPAAEALAQLEAQGGAASASGFKVSRSPRIKMLRRAVLEVAGERGEVRIQNLSSTGAMIEGIALSDQFVGHEVRIEMMDRQMISATIRWARNGKAGLQFAEPIDLDRLQQPPSRILRKTG